MTGTVPVAHGGLREPDPVVQIEIDEPNILGRSDERGRPDVVGIGASESGAQPPKCRQRASARPVSTGTASELASGGGMSNDPPALRLGTLSWLRQRTVR